MSSPIGALVLVLGLWFSLTLVCCAGVVPHQPHTVKYVVNGTSKVASLTYSNQTGNTEQISTVRVPWERSYSMNDGEFLYISAQNQEEFGDITTWIEVDGKIYQQTTSQGGHTIATSSMHCCP